jgi:GxxExxY protein
MERKDAKWQRPQRERFREPSDEVNRLSNLVIGAAMTVHQALGPGFLENIYEEAMVVELEARGISFQRQLIMPVYHRDRCIGESRLDLLVGGLLVVELKAVEELRSVHRAQVLSYLRAGAFELGLLINFNVALLQQGLRRVVWTR